MTPSFELALEGGAGMVAELAALDAIHDPGEVRLMLEKMGLPESVFTYFEQSMGRAPKGSDIFKSLAHAIREDGVYIEAGENDNLIVQKLAANPAALGIFGFSFLDQNMDKVQGSVIDGNPPTFENIASGDYAVSRPLYFYVKKAHVGTIPGIEGYIAEFVSERASGEDGYLLDKGLIPLAGGERSRVVKEAKSLVNLEM